MKKTEKSYSPTKTVTVRAAWEFEVDVSDILPDYVNVEGLVVHLTKMELRWLIRNSKISVDDFEYEIVR